MSFFDIGRQIADPLAGVGRWSRAAPDHVAPCHLNKVQQ